MPLTPHPAGLHPSQLGGSAGLLALSGALGALPPHLSGKDLGDKKPHMSGADSHPAGPDHLRGEQTHLLSPDTTLEIDKEVIVFFSWLARKKPVEKHGLDPFLWVIIT